MSIFVGLFVIGADSCLAYTGDFEDGFDGLQYNDGYISTQNVSGIFEMDNDGEIIDGSMSIYAKNGKGRVHLYTQQLVNLSFWMKFGNAQWGASNFLYVKVYDYEDIGYADPLIWFKIGPNSMYYHDGSSWKSFVGGAIGSNTAKFSIGYLNKYQVWYEVYYLGQTYFDEIGDVANTVDNPKMRVVEFYSDVNADYWIDNINYTIGEIEFVEDVTDYQCGDFSSLDTTGTGFGNVHEIHDVGGSRVLEFISPNKVNATYEGFDIYVSTYTNMEDYELYFGGKSNVVAIGLADCVFEYGDGYLMRWVFDGSDTVTVDDERLLIQIRNKYVGNLIWYHSILVTDSYQFYGQTALADFDHIYGHSNNNLVDDNLNGFAYPFMAKWKAYHQGYQSDDVTDCGFSNSVQLINFYENYAGTGEKYAYCGEYASFLASVSTVASPFYQLHIYDDGVEIYEQFFPYDLINCRDTYGFTPDTRGLYWVNITDGAGTDLGVGKKFYVIGDIWDEIYGIRTFKNPSAKGSDFTLEYFVNATGSYRIYGFKDFEDVSNPNMNYFYQDCITGDAGNWKRIFPMEGVHDRVYFRIFKSDNGTYIPASDVYIHNVKKIVEEGYIRISNYDQQISATEYSVVIDKMVTFHGVHNYIGFNVRISKNGLPIYENVNTGFMEQYRFDTEGNYKIALDVLIDDTWEEIDSLRVYVAKPSYAGESADIDAYDIIIGLGISIGLGVAIAVAIGSPVGFPFGFIVGMIVMSRQELGVYQMLPTEVASVIIVGMLILLALVWILDL